MSFEILYPLISNSGHYEFISLHWIILSLTPLFPLSSFICKANSSSCKLEIHFIFWIYPVTQSHVQWRMRLKNLVWQTLDFKSEANHAEQLRNFRWSGQVGLVNSSSGDVQRFIKGFWKEKILLTLNFISFTPQIYPAELFTGFLTKLLVGVYCVN